MDAIKIFSARSVPLMNDNIDTDQIIPKQFLKNILKTGFGKDLLYDWRYLKPNVPNPDFVLNKPERQGAQILVTGENFGCGSSREHAVWALKDYGFKVIIAGGYSDIFYMNSTKNGVLAIKLPKDQREYLANVPPEQKITVNLIDQKVQINDKEFFFDIDERIKYKLVNGLDDIAITMNMMDEIKEYESHIPDFN
ncbi:MULTISPECIES: 3-isopropylmalate dehydratase small subunit [Lactobacillaceae]|uniref:3-isopropylmalate dehydratase small subunit n=1 Tax=Apilactobacillus kunkeei TaxID=148814 RepID=A0A0N0CT25_9LACO|nr:MULTISPECIES: 3-isopropylmalate dehydratase small subunit [Lactobacillaceae]KOY77039.1 3-isopropylmalate dehydratase small subunit [Apilactobacillus kunkeei]KPN83334.1 3-isopropylmalate dehydratase small subunit [Apilactobacillus kunkeei]KPN84118.1 3-isopropylmalate dehydratase small subunit [Apilactobacillus kunkeei]MCX8743768.1 3-isopropylmalate dehydratase small subunit [Lactobacillus sp. B3795]GAT90438.1 3-isopropylmalate dehydratase small subunit [Apilactobacillus kunkeei]